MKVTAKKLREMANEYYYNSKKVNKVFRNIIKLCKESARNGRYYIDCDIPSELFQSIGYNPRIEIAGKLQKYGFIVKLNQQDDSIYINW